MPRYDYRCTACGNRFEVEHGMREHPETTCPLCGSPAERVLSASGIVLKGSGFYNTDQRGKKGPTEATMGGAEPEPGAKDEKGGTPKSGGGEAVGRTGASDTGGAQTSPGSEKGRPAKHEAAKPAAPAAEA